MTEMRREETLETCDVLRFGRSPQMSLTSAQKNSSWKQRRRLRVWRGEREIQLMQTVSGHLEKKKLVYFFSCCQKNVTGDIKRWKMRKLHYHPKITCPFPALHGKENWNTTLRLTRGYGLLVPSSVREGNCSCLC